MRIFILDNEMVRLRNLRSILASLGYKSAEVESSDDPTNTLNALKKKPYNVLFVVMTHPKMHGFDIVKEIRSSARLKSLPVIVYSGEVSKENVVSAAQAGASAFLGYPFSVSDVESALKVALKGAK